MSAQPYGCTLRGMKHIATSWVVRAAAWLVRRLPASCIPGLSRFLAGALMLFAPRRQAIAENNIRRALGDGISRERVRQIRVACVRNMARTMLELLRFPAATKSQIMNRAELSGREHLDRALARGKGVLIITAHFGNWEFLGVRMAAEGYSLFAVARDAAHSATAQVMNAARECTGATMIERDNARQMLRALQSQAILFMLPDQHVAEGGVVADFLGRPAMTATGPANLAARTDCPVLPAFCGYAEDGSLWTDIQPPLQLVDTGDRDSDIVTNTQRIADAIAAQIRKYPEQWLWLHRRWKIPEQ